ncbi:MAG: transporter permease [Amycolatopsis sp.]|uniref:ABC transporter permease n=1 Tax=Amycolatopsis sp. TaxID=37632 RepID=UPI00263839BE|nr:ABC transporter permease [Amycolatopsis sp.]MCU1682311.1 transporter permease [Amycolatopsis sp.]
MIRTTLQWLASSFVLLFTVTALTFVLASLAPGDAVQAVLSDQANPTPMQYAQVRQQLGLDRPLLEQYWHWLTNVLHGNLGTDLFSGQPVADTLNGQLGTSLSIISVTLVVATILGVGAGVVSAVRGGLIGKALEVATAVGFAVPNFWLALVLIEIFAIGIPLFPATGYIPLGENPVGWAQSIALPVITLAAGATTFIARQTRDSMMRVLAKDFIIALRAHGLPMRSIVFKHALRNAAVPVVTTLGLMFIGLLGGTVFVENIFAIAGIGQQAVNASLTHNLPMIEGVALYFAVIVVVVNLLVDISYRFLSPTVGVKS